MIEAVLEAFARDAKADRLADAYLFVGPSAAALRTLALDCARAALDAYGPLDRHADFVLFDPEELGVAGLRVEHVAYRREGVPCLETALRYRPAAGGRRAVVLLGADRMNTDAQGALLKTAEEPPPGTVLLLTANALSALTPALRSRCRLCRVAPRAADSLEREAAARGISERDWPRLVAACGSGEAALELDDATRGWLVEDVLPGLVAWRDGNGPVEAWLQPPQGAKPAEQRRRGALLLAAAQGLLAAGYGEVDPARAAWRDAWMTVLDRAQGELAGQVTPAVIFEDLLEHSQGPAA